MRIIGIILTAALCFGIFMVGGFILHDGYNPVSPKISTKYSAGYSELKFDEIEVGMDTTDVISLIGQPFDKGKYNISGIQPWRYTTKGNCKWNEFAWFRREVIVDYRSGKVRHIKSLLFYE